MQVREVSGGVLMNFSATYEVKNRCQGHPFCFKNIYMAIFIKIIPLLGSVQMFLVPQQQRLFSARQLKNNITTHGQ